MPCPKRKVSCAKVFELFDRVAHRKRRPGRSFETWHAMDTPWHAMDTPWHAMDTPWHVIFAT